MRATPPARVLRGRSLTETSLLLGGLVLAAVVLASWLAGSAPASGGGSSLWWLALLFGGACALAGGLWVRQTLADPLRAARMAEQSLIELAEAWVWHSDTAHRLTDWRPPQGAPDEAWRSGHGALPTLWELFNVPGEAPTGGGLRARLDAHAVIHGLRVVVGSAGSARLGTASAWRLRALPHFDTQGRFAGYVGTAVPLDEREQQAFELATLRQLWQSLEQVAISLRATEAGWVVASVNPDAARLLGLAQAPEPGTPWEQAATQLPPELGGAIKSLSPGQQCECQGWQLSLKALPEPAAARLLLLSRPAGSAPSPEALSASDHESFVYSVSHDLRAPIRVVEGFARILKEDYGRFLDRIGNDHLDRVLAAAARMNSMIDALLALSRLQSQPLARKPVDLSQLASFIVEDLRSEAPERCADIQIEPGLMVQGDPTLLRIAMENLLGNAWKYSSQSAQTVIEFRRVEQDGQRVFVVADQGAGFDMRFADRLFGVFQRLHSPKDFQGTGVGLASVRRILRRHGGDIWAESEVGKGARFYFTLPG